MTSFVEFRNGLSEHLGEFTPIKWVVKRALASGSTIFAFHRVLPRGAACFEPELCTFEDTFADFLDWIAENYRVIPFHELASRKGEPTNRQHPDCAITFDDGWYDNFAYAFPHLQRRGLTATIFLPTRFIGTERRFWQEHLWLCLRELNERKTCREVLEKVGSRTPWFPPVEAASSSYSYVRRLLLTRPSVEAEEFTQQITEYGGLIGVVTGRAFVTWEEVHQMQTAGISFGSHTLNHTLLANASPRVGEAEIHDSRAELESRIKEPINTFAYPWGAVGPGSLGHLQESGYKFAVTTQAGLVTASSNPHLLPRLSVSDSVLVGKATNLSRGKARLYFTKQILTSSSKRTAEQSKGDINKRIKILFVIDLITEWEGGTERQLRLLIQSLDPKYFEPKLCFLFGTSTLPKETLPCPLHVISPSGWVPAPVRLWRLIRTLRHERPDIIQCFFVEGLVSGIVAGRLAGVRQVVGSVRNAGYWRKLHHRLILRAITPMADYWQTNSRTLWTFQNAVESVPAAKIEILPNGADVGRLVPATKAEQLQIRRELQLNETGPICVSVANLHKVKGLETLVKSAALLRHRFPSIQIIFVGGGEQLEALHDLANRLGVAENVKFVGRQADVRPYLAAADIAVLTSRSEGSSNSVLEYMAMAIPSVVSDIPANRELLDQVIFKTDDEVDLADKISYLWQDTASRERLSREYRENALQYGIERFADRAQSFYSRISRN